MACARAGGENTNCGGNLIPFSILVHCYMDIENAVKMEGLPDAGFDAFLGERVGMFFCSFADAQGNTASPVFELWYPDLRF